MKRLALMVLLAALAGCEVPAAPPRSESPAAERMRVPAGGDFSADVIAFHDDKRSVTCWATRGYSGTTGGISCVPDWMLVQAAPVHRPIPPGAL